MSSGLADRIFWGGLTLLVVAAAVAGVAKGLLIDEVGEIHQPNFLLAGLVCLLLIMAYGLWYSHRNRD